MVDSKLLWSRAAGHVGLKRNAEMDKDLKALANDDIGPLQANPIPTRTCTHLHACQRDSRVQPATHARSLAWPCMEHGHPPRMDWNGLGQEAEEKPSTCMVCNELSFTPPPHFDDRTSLLCDSCNDEMHVGCYNERSDLPIIAISQGSQPIMTTMAINNILVIRTYWLT